MATGTDTEIQANLIAMQQMHEQTARLHSQFLETQQAAARSVQALLANQTGLVGHAPMQVNAAPRAAEVLALCDSLHASIGAGNV